MDNQEENTHLPKPISRKGTLLFLFFVWFVFGGLITWLPGLSDTKDSDVLNCALITRASFPLVILADYKKLANQYTDKLLIANFFLWLFFTGWTWGSA